MSFRRTLNTLAFVLLASPALAQVENRSVLHTFGEVTLGQMDAGTVYTNGASVADYPFPTAATVIEVLSASDNDGAGDETGCSAITIEGLDAEWVFQSASVSMSGQSAVDATGTWLRVNRAFCIAAGSGETNAGAITIRVDDGGATLATIPASEGQTLQAVFTTAAGQRFLMLGWSVSWDANNVSNTASCKLYSREDGGAIQEQDVKYFRGAGSPEPTYWDPVAPQVFRQKTDIYVYCSTSASAAMTAHFYGILGQTN